MWMITIENTIPCYFVWLWRGCGMANPPILRKIMSPFKHGHVPHSLCVPNSFEGTLNGSIKLLGMQLQAV